MTPSKHIISEIALSWSRKAPTSGPWILVCLQMVQLILELVPVIKTYIFQMQQILRRNLLSSLCCHPIPLF